MEQCDSSRLQPAWPAHRSGPPWPCSSASGALAASPSAWRTVRLVRVRRGISAGLRARRRRRPGRRRAAGRRDRPRVHRPVAAAGRPRRDATRRCSPRWSGPSRPGSGSRPRPAGIVELRLWARAYAGQAPRAPAGRPRSEPMLAGRSPASCRRPRSTPAGRRVPHPVRPGARRAGHAAQRLRPAAGAPGWSPTPTRCTRTTRPGHRCRRPGRRRGHPCAAGPRAPGRRASTPTRPRSACASPTSPTSCPRVRRPALPRRAAARGHGLRRPGPDLHGRRGVPPR